MSRGPIIVSNRHSFNKFRVLRATKNPCAPVVSLTKLFVCLSLLAGWTATVSKAESCEAIRHHLPELVETSPPIALKNEVGYRLFSHSDKSHMKTRFNLFRRAGVSTPRTPPPASKPVCEPETKPRPKSLLLNARNEAQWQDNAVLHGGNQQFAFIISRYAGNRPATR